jgi:dTDP-4-dehydrorhamnose 3,5-epimerase
MPVIFARLDIPDLVTASPAVFRDDRGFFIESYKKSEFTANGIPGEFVQDNHSRSTLGTLRGLHYQLPPKAQGKLVRCLRGAIWDVAVDLRRSSPTFGQWRGMELSAENRLMLFIPPGFAHGFLALANETEIAYKCTDEYYPAHERCLRWDDPALAIQWPDTGAHPLLSPKDAAAPGLDGADVFA